MNTEGILESGWSGSGEWSDANSENGPKVEGRRTLGVQNPTGLHPQEKAHEDAKLFVGITDWRCRRSLVRERGQGFHAA